MEVYDSEEEVGYEVKVDYDFCLIFFFLVIIDVFRMNF